jgi:hypothetical protein
MSVSSFGSYEGHAPNEYGHDSGHQPVDPAAVPGPAAPWATEAGPSPGGVPGDLAVSHVTDWRMAVDELGRPIPPPPGYASRPAPDGPQPPTTLLPTAPFSPAGLFPVPTSWTSTGSPIYPDALSHQPPSHQPPPASMPATERAPFEVTTTAGLGSDRPGPPGDAPLIGPSAPAGSLTEQAASPYGSLPGVSLPSGVFVPASVPVPAADIGPGLTALDDGVIGVDFPPPYPPRQTDWQNGPDQPLVPGQPFVPNQPYGPNHPYGPDSYGPEPSDGPDRSYSPEPSYALDRSYGADPRYGPDQSSWPRPGEPSAPRRLDYGTSSRSVQGAAPVAASDWDVVGDGLMVGGSSAADPPAAAGPAVALPPGLADLAAAAAAAVQAVAADRGDRPADGAATGPVPLEPYRGHRRISPEDLAARHAVVREQVDYALAEIALARAAFRRACEDTGRPGWPFRDTEVDLMRRPAVAHALFCELAGVERLRVWAQELYWLQEQNRGFA